MFLQVKIGADGGVGARGGWQPDPDWPLFAAGMPAWDQQEFKVHPRYQLATSQAIIITALFALPQK